MSVREKVSEAQAAQMIGWSAAGLRSHRLQRDAEQVCARLSAEVAEVAMVVRTGPWFENAEVAVQLREHGLARVQLFNGAELACVLLTRTGENVGRRLRKGPRDVATPAPIEGHEGPVHYWRDEIDAWLDQHPAIRDAGEILAATVSHREAAKLLGVGVATLRSYRSKAQAAQNRIDAGEPLEDDVSVADRCPPSVQCGFATRYRVAEIDAWLERKGRVALGRPRGPGVKPPVGPLGPECPIAEAPVAKLRSKRSKRYQVGRGGAVSFKAR